MDQIRAMDEALKGRAGGAFDTTGGSDTNAQRDTTAADTTAADTTASDTTRSLGEILGGPEGPSGTEGRPFSALLQSDPTQQFQFLVEEGDVPRVREMLADSTVIAAIDPAYEFVWGMEKPFTDGRVYRGLFVVEREPPLTGEAIADAAAGF